MSVTPLAGPTGATTRLQLPYPTPDDTVDVPRDVKALADKLDATSGIVPAIVATLPSNPVEGQECVYHPTITRKTGANQFADPYWRLRRASSGWRYIGGTPYTASMPGAFTSALGGGFVALKSRCSVPALGDYRIRASVAGQIPGQNVPGLTWTLVVGLSDNAGAAQQWTEVASGPLTQYTSALAGDAYFHVTSLAANPNFESWVWAPGYAIASATLLFGTISLEPILL